MKQLIINSPLYGRVKITEPVLIDLIKSPALQRLKHIEQHGTWQLHDGWSHKNYFSRYTHSVGVMLLLKRYNAGIEEQLHGLLHDVSHTVFSHVADFLFGNNPGEHNYQDSRLDKAFELQGVNRILNKHGYKPDKILSTTIFPLAENELPNLCADRIDYTLSDPWAKSFYRADPKKILEHLQIHKNKFIFDSRHWAEEFAHLYEQHNKKNWCNPVQIAIYTLSAQILREALDKKIIKKQELYTTDQYIIKKLRATKNLLIVKKMRQLKKLRVKIMPTETGADFWSTSKPRVVDPLFWQNGKMTRLTKVDTAYQKRTAVWTKKIKKGFYLKILN